MRFDDVFTVAQACFNVIPKRTLNKFDDNIQEQCCLLHSYLTAEFASQKRIARNSKMALYFNQWTELTRRLINYLGYGRSAILDVQEWEHRKIYNKSITKIYFDFSDKNEKKKFRRIADYDTNEIKPFFFLHIAHLDGREENIKCELYREEDQYTITADGEITDDDFLEMEYKLPFYEQGNASAERRQLGAFDDFRSGKCASAELKELMLQAEPFEFRYNGWRTEKFFNPNISCNERQIQAVCSSICLDNFYMIQGPPGTGKTTVIKELILQFLSHKKYANILVVSQANVAVDNVLKGIVEISKTQGIVSPDQIIRCGQPDKIDETLRDEYSYEGYCRRYIERLDKKCRYEDERSEWKKIISRPENKGILSEWMLKGFQIIGSTCVGLKSGNFGLSTMEFDLVIIDEAGKALPGELLIPINHAHKLIIIGDHKQLPPVINPALYRGGDIQVDDVVEEEEYLDFFNRSFFERLWEKCPDTNKCMLNTQFRMPPVISGLVNLFYDGKLNDGKNCGSKKPMMLKSHLIFIDMQNMKEYHEEQQICNGRKTSPCNYGEAEALVRIIGRLTPFYNKRIVVITPYKKQKYVLIKKLCESGYAGQVHVDTIDAFQGDEEDIVVFCTTRNDIPTRYFGDNARLNVAFSRARNTLMIIGDRRYFSKFNRKMKIRQVDSYLNKNALYVPYEDFIRDAFDLRFDKKYNDNVKLSVNVSDSGLAKKWTEYFNNIILEKQRKEKLQRYCPECGNVLKENENVLCFSCYEKTSVINCRCCGKIMNYSLADKYINSIASPELCPDCGEYVCKRCNKYFYDKKNYIEKIRKEGKDTYCKECLEQFIIKKKVGTCKSCGHGIYMTRQELEDAKNVVPKLCSNCGKFLCKRCNKYFYDKKTYIEKIKKEGHDVNCPDCIKEKKSVYMIQFCTLCGKEFEITQGEKEFLESKGYSLPRKCKDCRHS